MGIDLAGRTVLVTGASIGIGRAVALQFAAAGCRLALTYFEHRTEAAEVAERCRGLGAPDIVAVSLQQADDAIINIGSSASLHGTATLAPYCAAKWGVRGFTKALALEHPDRRIVCVHPGHTATRMNDMQGMPPERVAEVVLRVARGEIEFEPGGDVDVREYTDP